MVETAWQGCLYVMNETGIFKKIFNYYLWVWRLQTKNCENKNFIKLETIQGWVDVDDLDSFDVQIGLGKSEIKFKDSFKKYPAKDF